MNLCPLSVALNPLKIVISQGKLQLLTDLLASVSDVLACHTHDGVNSCCQILLVFDVCTCMCVGTCANQSTCQRTSGVSPTLFETGSLVCYGVYQDS